MRPEILLSAISLAIAADATAGPISPEKTLWYEAPAALWQEALPVGDGRMGMMPYGDPRDERIVLNDISLWSGSVANYDNPSAADSLGRIQQLLLEGKNRQAQELMYASFCPKKDTDGGTYGTYQMLAELSISLNYNHEGAVENYVRRLDLDDACAYTDYSVGGIGYRQECYVPRGSEVMIYHITASEPGALSMTVSLKRDENARLCKDGSNSLIMTGMLDSGQEGVDGMAYALAATLFSPESNADITATDSTLSINSTDDAYVILSSATDYVFGNGYADIARKAVEKVAADGDIDRLKAEGIANHRSLYGRAEISLPRGEIASLPTDRRIEAFARTDDPSLAALYYNFGRYLLVCSTQPDLLPPNLQGLWANTLQTPWNGDYHTNINVQMNHWPVEPGNLAELHGPLIDLVERSVDNGRHTAKVFYGDKARGWVMHMMTNIWGYTDPGEKPSWGATNTGGAWLCRHLWEHYEYNPDDGYLRRIYPVMKGAAEFFRSTMIREPRHGYLVTAPTSSPENSYLIDDDPTPISVCMGPTMDAQIVRELYTTTARAADILGVDQAFADSLRDEATQLPPNRIGSDGRLMEWLEEYVEAEPQHRHVSHLYGLYPGNEISVSATPELAEACRKTLDRRGDAGTGWSRAWKINFWARLADGNRAYKLFKALMSPAYTAENPRHKAGTFPNMFCSHPPFQIDGNWGGTAGIGEMLLQNHDGYITTLPALPDSWTEGWLRGFRVRGGATVDLQWKDSRAEAMTISSPRKCSLKLRRPTGVTRWSVDGGEYKEMAGSATLEVDPGQTIRLMFR